MQRDSHREELARDELPGTIGYPGTLEGAVLRVMLKGVRMKREMRSMP